MYIVMHFSYRAIDQFRVYNIFEMVSFHSSYLAFFACPHYYRSTSRLKCLSIADILYTDCLL